MASPRRRIATTLALAAILTLSAALAGCTSTAPAAPTSEAPHSGGVLRYGTASGPGNGGLDPFVATVYSSTAIFAQVYEPLISKDDTGKYIPVLATSWKQENELTYDFTLRQGVKFADGSALTPSDVIWTFTYAKKNSPQSKVAVLDNLKSIKDIGNNTVQFTFTKANPTFLPTLADRSYGFFIVDQQWYEHATKNERQTQSNGTGPFTLESWTSGVDVKLVRNKNYWDAPKPYLDGITFKETGDESTALALIQQGQLDAAWFWKPELADQAKDAGFTLGDLQQTSTRFLFIDPKYGKGVLSDIRIRQALSKAINRSELISLGTQGRGAITFSTPPAYKEIAQPSDATPNTAYDLEGAKKLLAEAGNTAPEITLTYGSDTADESILVLLQDQVAKAGFKLKLNPVPYEQVQNVFTTGAKFPSELLLVQDVIGSDPSASFGWWLKDGENVDTWKGIADAKEAKGLLATIDTNPNADQRKDQINQLNTLVSQQVLALTPFATPLSYQVWSRNVHGYQTDPGDTRYHWKDAWLTSTK